MKLGSGSYYLVIPQIELNESEGISMLAGTMTRSEDTFFSFKEALSSYHMSLIKACRLFSASVTCNHIYMKSILRKYNMIGDEMTQMVFTDSLSLCHGRRNVVRVEMVSPSW